MVLPRKVCGRARRKDKRCARQKTGGGGGCPAGPALAQHPGAAPTLQDRVRRAPPAGQVCIRPSAQHRAHVCGRRSGRGLVTRSALSQPGFAYQAQSPPWRLLEGIRDTLRGRRHRSARQLPFEAQRLVATHALYRNFDLARRRPSRTLLTRRAEPGHGQRSTSITNDGRPYRTGGLDVRGGLVPSPADHRRARPGGGERPNAPASVRPDSYHGVSRVPFARGVARDVTGS